MKTHLILLTAVAMAAVGCATHASAPAANPPGSGSGPSSAAAAPRATDPCAGQSNCTEIAEVDADGDGNPDRVGMTITREAPPPQVVYGEATIGVLIATGDTVDRIDVRSPGALPGADEQPRPYVGAYAISRAKGADLVFHTEVGGGSAEQFVVVGWSGGKPALVNRPPVLSANYPDPAIWYIGSSHGVHEWVTCAGGAAVTMDKLSAPTAEGIPLPGGGIRQEDQFLFDAGQWTPNGSNNVADNDFSYDFDPHTQTFKCPDLGKH